MSITHTPAWAVGLRKLAPGVYMDDKTHALHVSEAEVCEHFGMPYTQENAETIVRALAEVALQMWGDEARKIPFHVKEHTK